MIWNAGSYFLQPFSDLPFFSEFLSLYLEDGKKGLELDMMLMILGLHF